MIDELCNGEWKLTGNIFTHISGKQYEVLGMYLVSENERIKLSKEDFERIFDYFPETEEETYTPPTAQCQWCGNPFTGYYNSRRREFITPTMYVDECLQESEPILCNQHYLEELERQAGLYE